MKISLHSTKLLLSAISFFLLYASNSYSQETTLVSYDFQNTLNYTTLDPSVAPPPPTLTFSSSPSYHDNGGNARLQTDDDGDYLELTINTTGQQNMSFKFDANVAPTGSSPSGGWARWNIQTDNGTNGTAWQDLQVHSYIGALYVNLGFLGNIYNEGNISPTIQVPTTSEDKPQVRFRIRASFIEVVGNISLRIDNLRLVKGTPNISLYSNGNTNTPLPHNSIASIPLNTDFGNSINVGEPRESAFFRIRNIVSNISGAPNLSITGFTVTGTNASDFEVVHVYDLPISVLPHTDTNTIEANRYRQFRIRFTPSGDGLRTAQILIHSNGNQNPYIINVKGLGSSCTLFSTPHVINEFHHNLPDPTLPSDFDPNWRITGTSDNNNITRIYPDGDISLPTYNTPDGTNTSAWFTRNQTITTTFGGNSGINLSGAKNVSIAFNVGAYSSHSNSTQPNQDSYIRLEVQNSNGSWTNAGGITLYGGDNSTGYRYLIANPTEGNNYFEASWNGSIMHTIANSSTNKYQTIRLNIPESKILENPILKFRITAHNHNSTQNNGSRRFWIIDNVRIDVNNIQSTELLSNGSWTNGTPNNSDASASKKIIVPSGRTFNIGNGTHIRACECEVKAGGTLNIGSGNTSDASLTLQGKLVVENTGVLEVRNNSNLIQIEDDAQNSGNIRVVKRVENVQNSLPDNMDYIYWSSPVEQQSLTALFPGTPTNFSAYGFLEYNEATDYFDNVDLVTEPNFIPGKGYAIRAEGQDSSYSKNYVFTGKPNNGPVQEEILLEKTGNGYNLIGNPYPSNLDADLFLQANPDMYATIFFWENNIYSENQQGSGYYGSNYAIYNWTGGIASTNGGPNDPDNPNGIIKSGQGFIVEAKPGADGKPIVINNSMRSRLDAPFYYKVAVKDRFWLTLTTQSNVVNTMLVGYIPGATDGYEKDFDAELLIEGSDAIYSIQDDNKLGIQGLEYPFNINDVIPIGVKHFAHGKYKIDLKEKEGVFTNQRIYLKDKYLDIIHNLSQGGYEYEGFEGIFNDRFEIVFKKASFTETAIKIPINKIDIDKIDHHIVISSSIDNIIDVEVFNLSGWSIYKKSDVNTKEFKIPFSTFAKQIIVVNVKTETGEIVSKKFILN